MSRKVALKRHTQSQQERKRESQSVSHVKESMFNSAIDPVLQAAQQAIMNILQTVAVNSLRLLNATTSAITHTIKIKLHYKIIPMKFTARDEIRRVTIRPPTAKATEINRIQRANSG
jgi:hypothetical protein